MLHIIVAILVSISAFAKPTEHCIPKSPEHRYAAFYDVNPLAMTKAQFNADLDLLERVWGPYFDQIGCPLDVQRDWDDPTPNAYADRENGKCIIKMFGGLARAPYQTRSGQLYVACHELGHHIGGAPLYPADWASDEGQSDYWAALVCMKALGRSSSAGRLALSKVLAHLNGEPLPSRSTRSKLHRSSTMHTHPPAQCRLDLMDAGATCRANGRVSASDPRPGTCHNYERISPYKRLDLGSRPRCQYRPVVF